MPAALEGVTASLARQERAMRWLLPTVLLGAAAGALAGLVDRARSAPVFAELVEAIGAAAPVWVAALLALTVPLAALFVLLFFMPISIFAVAYRLAGVDGFLVIGAYLGFMLSLVVALLVAILACLAVLCVALPIGPGKCGRALGSTLLLAATTRSSYACLGAATESALRTGRMPEAETGAAIPVTLATFRASRSITSVLTLLFLAQGFGVTVPLGLLASFYLYTLLGSMASPGIPGSRLTSAPYIMAAGVPIEACLVTRSVDDLPDVFKTMLNVIYPIVLLAIQLRVRRGVSVTGDPA